MNPELENLVNNLLSKGELKDRSRELLIKKAEQLGVDPIDFELELEERLAETKTIIPPTLKSNKEGIIRKCPSCGAPVESFNSVCKDCGHEFRNINSSNAVQDFYNKYSQIESLVFKEIEQGKLDEIYPDIQICERQARLVSVFPIPNTREDILEFLTIAVPEVNKKVYWMELHKKQLRKAWRAKCEQIVMKGRLSLKADSEALSLINLKAKELDIK